MKIRIYETDFEGNPVECTGDFFSGATALDIVNAMKMNPFQASRTPLDFMRWMLASIGQEKFALPDDEGKAALLFLQRLTTLGYARFEPDANEVDTEHLNLTRMRLILSIPFRRCREIRKSKYSRQDNPRIYI